MGTTSEKLTYLNETKQELKQAINNLGGDITSQTTFRNYVSQLENVYDNLPKTSFQEGTEVTLSNTLKGKLDYAKEFQEVEYIESIGTQYIDTGYIANNNTSEISVKFNATHTQNNGGFVFGGEVGFNTYACHLYNSSSKLDIGFGAYELTDISYDANVLYEIIIQKGKYIVNGNEYTAPRLTGDIQTNNSIYLFALNRGSGAILNANDQIRMYHFAIKENNVLVRDMVPCYRKSDGVIGMYDKVQDKFYTNIGTSTFTKGADIGDGFGDIIVGIGNASQKSYQGYQMIRQASFGTFTNNGVTFTQRADGSILVNGTTGSNGASINLLTGDATVTNNDNNIAILPNQAYTLSGANDPIRVVLHTSSYSYVKNANTTFTETDNVSMSALRIIVPADTTINNVVMYPMLEKGSTAHDYEPYVGGTASPNPSYPQDIEVVRGKNLFDGVIERGSLANGQNVNSGTAPNWRSTNYIKVSPNTEYAFSVNSIINRIVVSFYTSNKTWINRDSETQGTISANGLFTTPSNCEYIRFRSYLDDFNLFENGNIMIEKGSQATSYLPYNTIEVVERGKNYSNLTEATYTSTGNTTAKVTSSKVIVNGTTTQGTNILGDRLRSIGTLKKGTYVFSTFILSGSLALNGGATAIYLRNSSNQASDTLNVSGGFNVSLKDKTFTLSQDTELFLQIFANASGMVFNNYEVGIQIEDGSTTTNFEEYQTPQTYQLSLGEYEFAKIGNYVDTIEYDVDEDKVYKNKAINKRIIDGTENWQSSGLTSVAYTNIITDYATSNNIPYCSHFKGENNCNGAGGMQDYGDNSIAFMQVSGSITPRLYIKKIGITTLQLRTLLAEIKPILYYALETAVKEEITGTLKDQIKDIYNLMSYTGTTILEVDGDLPMIIKVRALKGE